MIYRGFPWRPNVALRHIVCTDSPRAPVDNFPEMTPRNSSLWPAASVASLCLAALLQGMEPPPAVDPDVPAPFDAAVATSLLEHPPFTRALNLSESLLLTGVAYVDGKPVATIKDVKTNQSYLVSEEPNSQGWRL